MTTNARIRTIATGVTAEMIAEQTHLFYDPSTGGGYVSFQAREHLTVGANVQSPMGDYNILQVQLADIAPTCFGAGLVDPVTGADLSRVSAAGQALLMKGTYDQLYNAKAAADAQAAADLAAAQAAAQASAEPPAP
jgi:hypothetical protein